MTTTNMKEEITKLEFSGVEILNNGFDYGLRDYPEGYITKLMNKANEIGAILKENDRRKVLGV